MPLLLTSMCSLCCVWGGTGWKVCGEEEGRDASERVLPRVEDRVGHVASQVPAVRGEQCPSPQSNELGK